MSPIKASPRPTYQESTSKEMILQTTYPKRTTHQELKTSDTTLQGTISGETKFKDIIKTSETIPETNGRLKSRVV